MTASKTYVGKPRPSFLDLADQTPASRDRYVDFLRAFSICIVVLGHWLVTVVYWKDGRLVGVNALEVIQGLWLTTWLLQVMPLFFFVGGFSNLVTLDSLARKGGNYSDFVSRRAARLLKPTAVFLAVWLPISIVLDVFFNLNVRAFELSMKLLTAPLWFLGVYLIMIGMAPKMLKIHRRYGRNALITMAAGAVVVDVLGIYLEVPFVGALNYLFIWLFAHQLGFFYADGSLLRLGRKAYLAMAAGGLGSLVLLTTVADYSSNMVFNVHGRSNTNPPTICILVLTVWQVGLAMLLREPVSRVLARAQAVGRRDCPERHDDDDVPVAHDCSGHHRRCRLPVGLPRPGRRNPAVVGPSAGVGGDAGSHPAGTGDGLRPLRAGP
ncbi:MAG TPA: acyltransferase, partial [Actinomycetota bacterium]|nr:acyltransferase [Actinomycetota bacterium]